MILTVLVRAFAVHGLLKMIIAILIHAKWHETITILAKYNLDKYRDTLCCFQGTFFLTEFDDSN